MTAANPRVHLVVGAGGPTGGPFIHAVLDVLSDRLGWDPSTAHTIVGTSAGAFVAARIPPGQASLSADVVTALRGLAAGSRWRATPVDRTVVAIRHLAGRVLASIAPRKRDPALYDVPAGPHHPGALVVTVRRRSKRSVHRLAERDDVTDIVRASAAIPFANAPISIRGVLHVDGAVHSPTNADVVDVAEGDVVVVIAPMVPASRGSLIARSHRSLLRLELAHAHAVGADSVVFAPPAADHERRRERGFFQAAGTRLATEAIDQRWESFSP